MKFKGIIIFVAMVALGSCQKSPVQEFCGSYSFKTGGFLELSAKYYQAGIDAFEVRDTVIQRSISSESGQMRVVADSGNNILMTMNVTGGSLIVMNGTVDGNNVTFGPVERKILVFKESGLDLVEDVKVKVSATGRRLGNSIILDFDYEGNFTLGAYPCTIISSNVKCAANRNE